MFKNKTILALGAHPDDIEFSSGATIKKMVEEGANVYWAVFSPCIKSLPSGSEYDRLFREMAESARILGVDESHIFKYNFEVRYFYKMRQDILEELIVLKKKINPDMVLIPNSVDVHQDHQIIHNEGVRAFKNTCLLGYELPWNDLELKNQLFVEVSKDHVQAKVDAIARYQSQDARFYKSAEFYFSLATVRGTQVSKRYAESFEVLRWVI
ncbi:MAG: PIG-L deacetylase family protein [Salinivirgaceae bacterium]